MTRSERPAFGEVLQRYRVAAGLTQEALAERAGLSARGVHDLERAVRRAPNSRTLRRLAAALDLPATDRAALQAAARRPADNAAAAAASVTHRLPTGTVSFLFTDLEASTRLWDRQPEITRAALARHDQLIEALVAEHGGTLVRPRGEGDSRFAVFPRASDAVAAACAIQRAFNTEPWPTPTPLRVRMAVHTGEADLRMGDYYGSAVNRCARLRGIAHGGQIVVSGVTANLVRETLSADTTLRDLGSHRLKDLAAPERVFQLLHPDIPTDFLPLNSLSALRHNLPIQLASFVGRERELEEIKKLLARGNRLVTLTGAGGVGKSRLALQVAAELVDRSADGVWWVELAPVSDPERVPHAVATVVGLREERGRPLIDTLAQQLGGVEMVLVIDNCEHVLDVGARLIETLLVAAAGVRVVATSREPLGVPGEVAWQVPCLDEASAVDLFVERAMQSRPGWQVDKAQTELIAHICHRLDGLPLAIELAAARTRMMHPAKIAAGLDDRFRLLTGGSRTALPRQKTLEASVGWSYDLLDEHERALLRCLSVFAGGFSLEAAEAVCADGRLIEESSVFDLLSRLVDKSLIVVDDETDSRYRLLETVRQYAAERLVDAAETASTRARHLHFFLGYAERAEPRLAGADGPATLAGLEKERDNLRAALEWADSTGAHEPFLGLVTALAVFWVLRGHTAEGGWWFARALAHDDGPSAIRAGALWGAAYVSLYGDDHETCDLRSPQALAMARDVDDSWAIARATNVAGYLTLWHDPAGARAELARSIELARSSGDRWALADAMKMMTIAWMVEDDHDAARSTFDELLGVAQQLGNNFYIAWYHTGMAIAALRRGEFGVARRECERSLQLCSVVGDPSTAGLAIAWLGEVEALTGNWDAARGRYEAFLQRARATGGDQGFPFALINLATLMVGCGRADKAVALTRGAVDELRSETHQLPLIFGWLLTVHGAALLDSGDQAAIAALTEADQIAASTGNPWLIAMCAHHLGRLARQQGHTGRAEDLHHHALALRHAHRLRPGVVESMEALAGLAAQHQSAAEAARLFAAAAALRTTIGLARWPAEQTAYDEDLAFTRQQLGEDGFARAWAEGETLTDSGATAYATRARGQRRRPATGWFSLTPTETEVVHLLAQGRTNPEIANRLFISRATVKTHLIHIFTKLGVTTRSQVAAEATRRAMC